MPTLSHILYTTFRHHLHLLLNLRPPIPLLRPKVFPLEHTITHAVHEAWGRVYSGRHYLLWQDHGSVQRGGLLRTTAIVFTLQPLHNNSRRLLHPFVLSFPFWCHRGTHFLGRAALVYLICAPILAYRLLKLILVLLPIVLNGHI